MMSIMCSIAETISCFTAFIVGLIAFILYRFLDHIIRIPLVGDYKDRYILITGCDTGFGNLIAKRLDQLGCHVFAGCLTEKGKTELIKVCSERLEAISLDVARKESVRNALEYVKERLPQGRGLWGILNNAGSLLTTGSPDWLIVDDFKDQCDVNLWGLIDVTLTFLPLVKKEKGRVVNTASICGRISRAMGLPYVVSKYGVEAFTDGIRRTIHYFGCKASLIEPGSFRTTIGDSRRILCAELWQRTSPEVKAEYGDDYIAYMIDAYEHALLGRHPRARYLVGYDAKYLLAPIQALPEWLGDWILRRFESGRPLPHSVKK